MTSEGFEDGIERRVRILESRLDRIESKLDTLIDALHAFRHDVDARFAGVDVALPPSRLVSVVSKPALEASRPDL